MENGAHPSKQRLSHFMQGRLVNDSEQAAVESHLSSCQTCQAIAATLCSGPTEARIQDLFLPTGNEADPTGPFQIIEEIGRGGAGVVYRARQDALDREVALKLLASGVLPGGENLIRFRRESKVLAQLSHPHIVTVFDSGEQHGVPYIAMEWIQGPNLAQWLLRELPPPRVAAHILLDLADAMEHAHQAGVLHRDLKPHNVLILESADERHRESKNHPPSTKIVDFGLSAFDDERLATVSRPCMGTPAYMSPEMASGNKKQLGPATDVYGLGTILYQCLTGRAPFVGDNSISLLQAVCDQDPPSIQLLRDGVPRDLQTICERCLEKDPEHRFSSPGELKADLQRFLDGRPIQSRRTSTLVRGWKWARRHPVPLLFAGLALIAVVASMLGLSWHQANLSRERDIASANYSDARATISTMLAAMDQKSVLEVEQLRDLSWKQTVAAMDLYASLAEAEQSRQARYDLAQIKMRAGTLLIADGKFELGQKHLDESAAILEQLTWQQPDDRETARALVSAQIKSAIALSSQKKNDQAVAVLQSIRPTAEKLNRLDQDVFQINQVSWLYHNLGNAQIGLKSYQDAADCFARETELVHHALTIDPENPELRRLLQEAHISNALCQTMLGHLPEAREAYESSIALLKKMQADQPNDTNMRISIAVAYLNLSNVYAGLGKPDLSVQSCGYGIEQLQPIITQDSTHHEARSQLTMLHGNRALYGSEELKTSLEDWRRAVELSVDDETREYCRSMYYRQMLATEQFESLNAKVIATDFSSLSNANRFRMAALAASLADQWSAETPAPEDAFIAQLLEVAKREVQYLSSEGYFHEHAEAHSHVLEHADFNPLRRELGVAGIKDLLTPSASEPAQTKNLKN